MRGIVFRIKPALVVGICAGAVLATIATGQATRAIQTAASQEKRPIYSVETDRKAVSLGINCAWGNEDIPALIEILDNAGVKATFFVVGDWCEKYPESVKLLHDAGHEIGTHSDTHTDMTKLDRAGILRELRDSAAKIEAITGERVRLFRPPSGAYNTEVIATAEEEGFYPIQWDCDSLDYRDPTPAEMEARILKNLQSGSILLFHSGAKNTPASLPGIIASIQAQGYKLVPVSELIHPAPYRVDFEGRQHKAD
jgi:polysaccharide deacetylase family sporulation protein PdaB